MNQSKQVRISGETLEKLKTVGQPFESVDECLRRVLSTNPCKTKESKEEPEEIAEAE